jgi:hypothetical protein
MTIVEKIRALLAKAASSDHAAEAEVFLAKAHELMEKHQLESLDLEHDDPVGNENVYPRNNPDGVDWDFTLLFSVARYFGCRAIRLPQEPKGFIMDLVGRESARITAIEMHKYLIAEVKRLAKEAVGTREFRKIVKRGSNFYWQGDYLNREQCARRIGNALTERLFRLCAAEESKAVATTDAGKNALITLDAVEALYAKLYPDTVKIGGPGIRSNNGARELAAGIGLNLQTGNGSSGTVRRLA